MSRHVVVLCAVAGGDDAEHLAHELVSRRLAACVNVVSGVVSIYRWKGNVERDQERLLVIKTRAERFEELKAAILSLHSYEVPEVVALPVLAGHEAYLSWIDDSTA